MRALFIYPNINTQIGFNYGIAYISGLLKHHGVETSLLNVNEKLGYPLDIERIQNDVARIRPDVVGFSVLTNQVKYAEAIADAIKEKTDVPIIFGGIHPTMAPLETLEKKSVDWICVGEGEEAFLELLGTMDPRGVGNIGYRENGESIVEPLRPFTDITRLPFKDYEIFDFQRIIDAKDGWVGLTASRGCPFRCTYCLNHKIMALYRDHGHLPKTYLRRHTVDQMMEEIEYLLSNYSNITMFIFDDDIFAFDRPWLEEFTKRYRATTNIGFVCNAHARVFDNDTARLLKEGGCRIVKFGLESGSDRMRRTVLHRYMSNDHIAKAFEAAHAHGLHTSAFVMMGLPREKREDLMDTVDLLGSIRPGRARWSLFFPFIGTRAYEIAKESGQIDFKTIDLLDNFFDESCMKIGADEDLLVKKMKEFFCLYLNARGGTEENGRYAGLVQRLESLDDEAFEAEKAGIRREMEAIDREMEESGKAYYMVKYNPFMAVRSDWKDDSPSA